MTTAHSETRSLKDTIAAQLDIIAVEKRRETLTNVTALPKTDGALQAFDTLCDLCAENREGFSAAMAVLSQERDEPGLKITARQFMAGRSW